MINRNLRIIKNSIGFRYYCQSNGVNSGTTIIKRPPYKILFFGTDQVSINTLKALHNNQKQIDSKYSNLVSELQVVCPKSDKKELVEEYAKDNQIKIHYPDAITGMKNFTVPPSTSDSDSQFDLAVVVSFGYFIPKKVLNEFKYGGINMHPSLLPRHRGAAPIYHTILSGDEEAGVSIIGLHAEKFDAGNILMQVKHEIPKDILYTPLLKELSLLGSDCVMKTLEQFPRFYRDSITQSENGKTQANKVDKTMTKLEFANKTMNEIWTLYRAFSDNIGIYSMSYSKKYKTEKRLWIKGMVVPPTSNAFESSKNSQEIYSQLEKDALPLLEKKQKIQDIPYGGYFIEIDNKDKNSLWKGIMWIRCKDGWIGVTHVYEEGKKNDRVKSSEFLFGKGIVSPLSDAIVPPSQVLL
ncbi:methionyl-tRNA formyltransferase [Tieghemostelium lacteum]|uniref:methionyl-tRNA formyltransferase n=1 Tax=Tieghemostelium lacteum TaxID=361077 RepID=A0A151Z4E7_TIELA|nr:methionyl-tRNA formyltransferase [Tieghemostelium lacteum]|eukprot:KYQ88842.1 methionyl-tRNA formyltransferase [Tieghemostelium lacteum]